jgi:hypothetical protein
VVMVALGFERTLESNMILVSLSGSESLLQRRPQGSSGLEEPSPFPSPCLLRESPARVGSLKPTFYGPLSRRAGIIGGERIRTC